MLLGISLSSLEEVIFMIEVDDIYFNDSNFVGKLRGT